MTLIDISTPLHHDMRIYEGDPPFRCTRESEVLAENPDSCAVSRLTLGTHTGTHIDAPCHMIAGGPSVDELRLEVFCGPARVVDLQAAGTALGAAAFRPLELSSVERLLLKTSNTALLDTPGFSPDYAHLTLDAVDYLKTSTSVMLVGIDYLSVESPSSQGFRVHKALLEERRPIIPLEGIDLRGVPAGDYHLYCLPLCVQGGDGAPARAALRPL